MRSSFSEEGFSLLELLVAVAVLSMAIVPMLANQNQSLRNAAILHERALGQMVAENIIAYLTTAEPNLTPGPIQGQQAQAGIMFKWQGAVTEPGDNNFLMINLKVLHPEHGRELASLTGFRVVEQ